MIKRLLHFVLVFSLLCVGAPVSEAQTAFLRLLMPPQGETNQSKQKQETNALQLRLQKLEGKIDVHARQAAISRQLFDKELHEYQQLIVLYRQPLRSSDFGYIRWQQRLLALAQRCVSDLLRIQSAGQLQEQSRRDLREAWRIELDARLQLEEYLKKNYHTEAHRAQLLRRIKMLQQLQTQGRVELQQVAKESGRLGVQRARFQKQLDLLRRMLADLSGSLLEPLGPLPSPQPSTQPATRPSAPMLPDVFGPLPMQDAWDTKVSLLRLNRLRIRIRLLQMLFEEERLNRIVLESKMRFYEHSIGLIEQHVKRLARLSEGGMLHVKRLSFEINWFGAALTHTRALRRGRWPKLKAPLTPTKSAVRSLQWGGLLWLYIVLFVICAGLLVFVLFYFSQRAIEHLTKRAQEEHLLLRLWQFLRLCLRLSRDLASWLIFLAPALWLLHSVLKDTAWWGFLKRTMGCLLLVRMGWIVCVRLFSADREQRLLRHLWDESARLFRRTIKLQLMLIAFAYPFYQLLELLRYPPPFLEWLWVLYLFFLVSGQVFLLIQKDSILSMMPKNTIFERILIVIMFRLYPLVWLIPLVMFGLYLWGYRNLASYFAVGLIGSLGLLFLTDLLTAVLWASILWILGFTVEDESVLVAPPPPPQQVELDHAEGGPKPLSDVAEEAERDAASVSIESTPSTSTDDAPPSDPTEGALAADGLPAAVLVTASEAMGEAGAASAAIEADGREQALSIATEASADAVISEAVSASQTTLAVVNQRSEGGVVAEATSSSLPASEGDSGVVAAREDLPLSAEAPAVESPTSLVTAEGALQPTVQPYLRASRIIYVCVAALIWFAAAASLLEIWQIPGGVRAIPKAFAYPIFQATDLQITLWVLVQVFAMFSFTMWLTRAIPNLLDEYFYPSMQILPASSYVANALLRYFLMCVGIFLCLRLLNVGSRGFLILLAVFGLSLSYGLRKLVHNFISSLLIFFGRSIAVGDYIETAKHRGKVKKITARSTTLQTSTGKLILIPNGALLDGPIINWLAFRPYFRERIDLHVAIDSDVKRVQEILMQVAAAHPDVQATPKPTVRLRDMSGRSLEFGLTVTLLNPMVPGRIRSELRVKILERFRAEGVELALPQQELHLHPDLEEGLLQQLQTDPEEERPHTKQRWLAVRPTPPTATAPAADATAPAADATAPAVPAADAIAPAAPTTSEAVPTTSEAAPTTSAAPKS